MKKIILLLFCAAGLLTSRGQTNIKGYRFTFLGIGQSFTTPTKYMTLNLEQAGESTIRLGISLQGTFYNPERNWHHYWKTEKKIAAAGAYIKLNLSSNRNFSSNFQAGAYAGTDNHNFLWYPSGGFEQNIWVSPKTQIVIAEHVSYLFHEEFYTKWQPSLQFGLKFTL